METTSPITHSPVGSYHWYHTLAARVKNIGEFLKEKTPNDESITRKWGTTLYDAATELIDHHVLINASANKPRQSITARVFIVMTPEDGYKGTRTTKEDAELLQQQVQEGLDFAGSHQQAYVVEDSIIL